MWSCSYETVKYVRIKDGRLGLLRTCLLVAIALYVSVFELWAAGGWLAATPIVGIVRFSLQQPTVDNCDPNVAGCQNNFAPLHELPYCQQANKSTEYPGQNYPCQMYEATNAQIVSEKSIAVITRASTREQELVCHEDDSVCQHTYNDTSKEHKFYTAQSEAFTILMDHAVTATKLCAKGHHPYACSSEASQYQGRLLSKNAKLCAQEELAFANYRGNQKTSSAPCYITPNSTSRGQDFFSLNVLLQASNDVISLDYCNPSRRRDNTNSSCQTYRETGATLLLNIYWSDFHSYHGVVEPYYYYVPHVLPGLAFSQNLPFYHSYRTSRTLVRVHGIRIAVLFGGSFHAFDAVAFLVTLTTAVGLLAIATAVVEALMLYVLPEKERYQQAKYEQEQRDASGGGHEDEHHDEVLGGMAEAQDMMNEPVTQAEVDQSETMMDTTELQENQELNEPLLPT